ncbi:metal-sulfur cluster assembly factor [Flavihumibacter sp. R14]|nr:metal-sulfur cluster assembly factor [Flavihumibacter soli]
MEIVTNDHIKCNQALVGLYDVYDPEIGLNVVDLGLIYGINFNEERKEIEAVMTLTTQFCPMGESITNDVKQSVGTAFKDYKVNITLTFEPSWSPDFLTPEGEAFLNG